MQAMSARSGALTRNTFIATMLSLVWSLRLCWCLNYTQILLVTRIKSLFLLACRILLAIVAFCCFCCYCCCFFVFAFILFAATLVLHAKTRAKLTTATDLSLLQPPTQRSWFCAAPPLLRRCPLATLFVAVPTPFRRCSHLFSFFAIYSLFDFLLSYLQWLGVGVRCYGSTSFCCCCCFYCNRRCALLALLFVVVCFALFVSCFDFCCCQHCYCYCCCFSNCVGLF